MTVEATVTLGGERYRARLEAGVDIAIPLDFHGAQPSHFGAQPASAEAMQANGFTGDTREGGSCNVEIVTLNPHCNGTHTECVGHVTEERIAVREHAPRAPLPARLLSVAPERAEDCADELDAHTAPGDRVLCADALARALATGPAAVPDDRPSVAALVVRTLPNEPAKRNRGYRDDESFPYFTATAMARIVSMGVSHIVMDTPSLDRMHDRGALANHRRFWGLEPGETRYAAARRPEATVTELAYVDDSLADGWYLLDLQVAPFVADAAPSRPILYPLEDA